MSKYNRPPAYLTKLVNPILVRLVKRFGMDRTGMEVLRVRGRTSGNSYEIPVNPLTYQGKRYLVSPHGDADWVRNVRAAGSLSIGRKGKYVVQQVREVPDEAKAPILKAYLENWGKSTKSMFGMGKEASLEQLVGIATEHPVFEISPMKIM